MVPVRRATPVAVEHPADVHPRLDHEALVRVRPDGLRLGRLRRCREVDTAAAPSYGARVEALPQDGHAGALPGLVVEGHNIGTDRRRILLRRRRWHRRVAMVAMMAVPAAGADGGVVRATTAVARATLVALAGAPRDVVASAPRLCAAVPPYRGLRVRLGLHPRAKRPEGVEVVRGLAPAARKATLDGRGRGLARAQGLGLLRRRRAGSQLLQAQPAIRPTLSHADLVVRQVLDAGAVSKTAGPGEDQPREHAAPPHACELCSAMRTSAPWSKTA
mmetsp:Transcript_44709/g.126183  ORF Transcript_44709/g.126183 Transcript_44709/m.126183 type:complete len:275 (-) Transcript_44709:4-828(-)